MLDPVSHDARVKAFGQGRITGREAHLLTKALRMKHEGTAVIIKNIPSVGVAGTSLLGVINWQDWVYVATFIWIVMQAGQFAYDKWIKPWRKRGK